MKPDIHIKFFNELTPLELYQILKLRCEVFIVEQNCPYLDEDDKDLQAMHIMGFYKGKLAAYTRILPPGVSYPEASIGRVVTHAEYRSAGFGKIIMQESIRLIQQHYHTQQIVISAQQYLEKFYQNLGFKTESNMYLEDDIPHIQMRYQETIISS